VDPGRLARIAALLAEHAAQSGRLVSPLDVCEAASEAVHVEGGALSVKGGTQSTLVTATGPLGQQLADLQFTLGEGPEITVWATASPVLVTDLTAPEHARRWPVFAPAACDLGVRGCYVFPLHAGAIRVGTLQFYRTAPGEMTIDETADALVLADFALDLVLNGHAGVDAGAPGWLAVTGLGNRAKVHQATGMVSVQLGTSLEQALLRLKSYAYGHDLPIGEVAQAVVERRLRFEQEDGE